MSPRTETGWAMEATLSKKGHKKLVGNNKNGKKLAAKGMKGKNPEPPPPPEKYNDWWENLKSQIRFIMTGQGKSNIMLTDAEHLCLSIDLDQENKENNKRSSSVVRSIWSKLTPVIMRYTPQIFNIKPPKSSEKSVKDWLEAMPAPEKCKTDSTVESLWWPTTEEKVTEIIEDDTQTKSAYVPRKDRKPTGKVDPFLKMYSNTTQLVPFKQCSRSLVDLRTLETKRRNRICPKNRFCKNGKKAVRVLDDNQVNT